MIRCLLSLALFSIVFCSTVRAETKSDVVVYGGTSAGVIAAVQAKRMGKQVVIVGPDKHLGGLSAGGLGWTDTGRKEVIGGLSRDFYHRIWKEYQNANTWKFQKSEDYGGRGQGNPAVDGENRTMWIFEPRVAEKVYEDYVREFEIPVYRDHWLDRDPGGVTMSNGRIKSIRMTNGEVFVAKMFIDATYEGDLMAACGVDYHVGREGRDVYGEEYNGVQTGVLHHRHHFDAIPDKQRIDPYVVPGDPASGVLPRISPDSPGEKHSGDHRVQAYCFRMCLTNEPENRIPFEKPANYDPAQYELLLRILKAQWNEVFDKFDPIPNHKTDTNNHGPMSTDNIGMNYEYPEGSYEKRKQIIREHEQYQKGWLYFLSHDPRVPSDIQSEMRKWGLPKDEFTDNGHWSHQLYIREARRMVGKFVMTENELLQRKATPDSVGMGSYTIDSHNVQRYITAEGYVQNEGDIGVKCRPYQIAYGSLVPRKSQCQNLLVPVCVSSSHIAFGSIRMEPVFMILGQSAATAACQSIDAGIAVQDLPYETLLEQLVKDGQIVEHELSKPRVKKGAKKLSGVMVDDREAKRIGTWTRSTASSNYYGECYFHDGDKRDGSASATFTAKLPYPGRYEVRMTYSPNRNRASNVPVVITHADGSTEVLIDQRAQPKIDGSFVSLGKFRFAANGSVRIGNEDTDGYVIADAVQWLPVK
ncbi:FAD-dependent oxidoreductase [Mariniblastus fucicola]|uniref:Xanthan lyase n=1 Tax=Mariniblastus fucicola TaxID=980251 RepID=A0A5B9PHY8_9BACT|nr:FAD-dependent oxidoreductase [Mariniblastus fucicola]QEG24895.1 Xanthan lyase precursor [Mariniblastus fucicola]